MPARYRTLLTALLMQTPLASSAVAETRAAIHAAPCHRLQLQDMLKRHEDGVPC